MLRKIIGIILALLFTSFAALQYNDPDTGIWVAIYLVAAALCVFAAYRRVPFILLGLACAAFVVGAIYMWPEKYEGLEVGGGDIKNIEEAREALGLLLVAAVLFIYAVVPRRQVTDTTPLTQKG
ncbi:transmembrane 220 family protein [Pontibacter fetidus]|uniref:Transmembrane family 220, helix n=1 Tax=Pontibacter fetidus TaxID=2700082 RepID=A0A6B2H0N5_9BACT|nr:transmembrane 220 family protein [Pontibacter fetidus]NDK55881.1 hypothetical protein [Pontibacter fetidus]